MNDPDDIPNHVRIALASATEAFERDDVSSLGTINSDVQPLVDAAIAWGRRGARMRPNADHRRGIALAVIPLNERLRVLACNHYGWGPREGVVAFHVSTHGRGWQLGNGTVTQVWKDREVPTDALTALLDIEHVNGVTRG